nr:MAG: major capsid protein [Microviridae sp.]
MLDTPSLPSARYTFSDLPEVNMPRCAIKRPSTYKTTLNAGMLYPIFCDEALPGDTFTLDASVLARLSTPITPFMDNLVMDLQFFAVPLRLVWEHWQNFCGEKVNPSDQTSYTVPYVTAGASGAPVGSLADYFGLPTGIQWSDHDVQALPFRAYNLIWNEWYRDQNIQDSVTVDVGDTSVDVSTFKLLPRGKRKDYFTSALPWPQKGAAVSLGLSGSAPVVGNGHFLGLENNLGNSFRLEVTPKAGSSGNYRDPLYASHNNYTNSSSQTLQVSNDPSLSGLEAQLDGGNVSFSINALRQAVALQRLLETDARGGTRYTEILRAHFGVTSPDARLQRPELLGSFSVPLALHTVPQSSGTGTSSSTPQGNLSAFGLATGESRAFSKSFVEHSIIIGLCSIRSDLTYQQGIPRMWSRSTRYDYYWPELSSLGEQAILNKELYAQGKNKKTSTGELVDNQVFGYQERWSEYKYGYSKITGELRSTFEQSLDYWHLSQKFDELPTLSPAFIVENPPVQRVLAVTDAPQFILDAYFDLNCVRPMPLYCVPGLVNHF